MQAKLIMCGQAPSGRTSAGPLAWNGHGMAKPSPGTITLRPNPRACTVSFEPALPMSVPCVVQGAGLATKVAHLTSGNALPRSPRRLQVSCGTSRCGFATGRE